MLFGRPFMLVWIRPANAELIRDWTVELLRSTASHSMGGAYVNFMMEERAITCQKQHIETITNAWRLSKRNMIY